MDFIQTEDVEDQPLLLFSDEEDEENITDELDDFIDNSLQSDGDVSFYRQLDNSNVNDYPKSKISWLNSKPHRRSL